MTRTADAQVFHASHTTAQDFAEGGLRPYARYRDLGIAAATNGLAVAQVIRFVPPCTDEVRQWHTHDIQFQMVYVLKGWIKTEMDGHGVQHMKTGSCWIQPPGIRHRVVDYSDDYEVLEVVLPAEFETTMVDAPAS